MALSRCLSEVVRQAMRLWPSGLVSSSVHRLAVGGDREGLLEREKSAITKARFVSWKLLKHIRLRRYVVLTGAASLLSLLLLLLLAITSHKAASSSSHAPTGRHAQHLYLLIPTPDLHPELCKTILSAEVLHYPPPTLIPWDAAGDDDDAATNSQRRMTSVRDYLGELLTHHANDTAILVGDARVWFQLRPEVLLKRYFDVNRRANRRLKAGFGERVVRRYGVEQRVVFAASSECGAESSHCRDVPRYLTGAEDGLRFLGQGFAMGPVRDLYEIYRRAVAKFERKSKTGSQASVLREIFDEQESQRLLLRQMPQTWSEYFWTLLAGHGSEHDPEQNNTTSLQHRHPDEFGIGLDYSGELTIDASNQPDSLTWTQHNHLPPDISSSMPPFWTIGEHDLPTSQTWSDLPLLTNTLTNSIPAAITHKTSTPSDLLKSHWEKLWLRPFSRRLFDAHTAVPAMPLASVVDGEGVEQVFWSTTIGEKAGARDGRGGWYGWRDVCGGVEGLAGEVFGDGEGEWRDPRP